MAVGSEENKRRDEKRMSDYEIDRHGALRHKKCGGQIAVEAELYVISGLGFPHPNEVKGCRVERGPHGMTIARRFAGYRGYCMKCRREGNFYGPRYRPKRKTGRQHLNPRVRAYTS